MAQSIFLNIYFWIGLTFTFLLLFILVFIFVIILAKKTHAIVEFKAWIKKQRLGIFFTPDRYMDVKAIKVEAGIVTDKEYGCFIVNGKAAYVDRITRNIVLPFDAELGVSVNLDACKAVEELKYVADNREQYEMLRQAVAQGTVVLDDKDKPINLTALKTNVNIASIKDVTSALLPHNINSKIEKTLAARMKSMGQINVPQIILIFCAVLGAIIIGAMLIKYGFNKA